MTELDDTLTSEERPEQDRRAMLRRLAIGGAGAAIGAVALGKTADAGDQGGAQVNGNAIEIGETNTGTSPTIVTKSVASPLTGPSAFSVSNAAPGGGALFPGNLGGYGNPNYVHGVHGSTTQAGGFGVVAASLAPAAAAATDPVPVGLAVASLGGAQVKFELIPAAAVVGPTPGKHVAGELYVDKEGTLWFTVPTGVGDAVRFVKLAGAPASGSFHALNPQRAYDSRQTGYPVRGPIARNANRVISVANGHSSNGTVTLANAVPVGATAVQINVTAAGPTGPNFIAVTAGDVASTTTSLLNWDAGVTQIANSITIPVSPTREIKVFVGDQAGSTDVIVDVFGYYI